MAPRVAASGTFRGWARLAAGLGAAALLCHAAASLVGPGEPGDPAFGVLFVAAGLFLGLWAFGSACVARAYWSAGDGEVTGTRRLLLGCLLPLALIPVLFVAWIANWVAWLTGGGWTVVRVLAAAPLVLTVERLALLPSRWPERGAHGDHDRMAR